MAMILDAFAGRYVSKLSEFIEDEMSMMLGVNDELKKLKQKMETINGFLESAELKKHTDKNIHIWVKNLKDVMYDADDIMDLCMIEGRRLLENQPSKSVVCHPLSLFSCFSCIKFRHEIGSKIRELNNRLKGIVEDQSILPNLERINQDVHESRVDLRQTSPMENKSDIVLTQISVDTQHLVESLIKKDNKKCQVLGIVGMGGIGKTTLARHIYNDERIEKNFPIRVWACVSQNFSEIELLKQLIRSAGGHYGEANTRAELEPRLSSALAKNFFIVLDDVWRIDVWEDLLKCPLENATASGRIVITTRHINVARSMTADVHHVNKMDNDSGWTMLRKKVFNDDDEEEEISSLREIGVKIVEKCDGLPLAIKTIAGVLKLKEKSSLEWNKVLKSDAWSMSQLQEELPGALFLSYQDLPSNLKQCFLYCTLCPFALIHRESLIHLWVTEGLIKETQEDKIMEDAAEDYHTELVKRNLLQEDYLEDGW